MASSSMKDLLQEYHRLAADTLLGGGSNTASKAVLEAAETGQHDRLQRLLSEHPSAIDSSDPETGDTPIIAAARNNHTEVIDLLIKSGADVTLENVNGENALNVCGGSMRKHILECLTHEDRSMTNAQALLQSAWLGDAVSVKKCLSGSHYIDVNCSNCDGVTPLLLVTKDLSLFTEVQEAMETNYNPVGVLEELLTNHADVNRTDRFGRSPLQLVAESGSIHARKMVSLLLSNGSSIETADSSSFSPLHIASAQGHVAIIVALVEEGGADVNMKGGETGDTPLMLSVRGGHSEAARYLLSQGADVTMVDDKGDCALSVARSPGMKRILRRAWTEQTQEKKETSVSESTQSASDNEGSPPESPTQPDSRSFFLTDRQVSRSLDFEEAGLISPPQTAVSVNEFFSSTPHLPQPQLLEADDELDKDPAMKTPTAPKKHSLEEMMIWKKSGEKKRGKGKVSVSKVESEGFPGRPVKQGNKSTISYHSMDKGNKSRHESQGDTQPSNHGNQVMNQQTGAEGKNKSADKKLGKRGRKEGKGLKKVKGKEGRRRSDSDVSEKNTRPTHLASQTSMTNWRGVRDSHMTRGGGVAVESVTEARREDKLLPEVAKSPPSPSPNPISPHSSSSTTSRLPSLKNLQRVAIVSLDTEQNDFKVHKFSSSPQRPRQNLPMHRSQSLMTVRAPQSGHLGKKRNSLGALDIPPQERQAAKATLLPNVVTPQFGPPLQPPVPPPNRHPKPPQKHPPLSLPPAPKALQVNIVSPTLSVVEEGHESLLSSSRSGIVLNQRQTSSDDSTLKASSHSDFETDSLERQIADNPSAQTPVVSVSPLTQHSHQASGIVTHSISSHCTELPPTLQQFMARQASQSHAQTPTSNTVINYAVPEGSLSLSPIWNQMQNSPSHTDDSTQSEYITSYISHLSPPPAPPLDPENQQKRGMDSGHGDSTDEERGDKSGTSSSSEAELQAADTLCLKWKRGRLLGKGAFGKVWEGLLDSAKMIAVKEVELGWQSQRAESQYKKIRLEVEILRSLKHKNVVSYLGTSTEDRLVFIFMEFISGGSIRSILNRFGPLEDKTSRRYTRQVVSALSYMHSKAIVHRDIKGANIMVTSRGVIKLIDFGCAKQSCGVIGELHSVRGTPYWMAPEVIRGEGYGFKSDIWSLGCTVHEMAVSKPPWADHPPEAALFQIGKGNPIPQPPGHLSDTVVSFIFRCVSHDTSLRPTANDLLDDPFLASHKGRKRST